MGKPEVTVWVLETHLRDGSSTHVVAVGHGEYIPVASREDAMKLAQVVMNAVNAHSKLEARIVVERWDRVEVHRRRM